AGNFQEQPGDKSHAIDCREQTPEQVNHWNVCEVKRVRKAADAGEERQGVTGNGPSPFGSEPSVQKYETGYGEGRIRQRADHLQQHLRYPLSAFVPEPEFRESP